MGTNEQLTTRGDGIYRHLATLQSLDALPALKAATAERNPALLPVHPPREAPDRSSSVGKAR